MLLFAHAGITLGAAVLLARVPAVQIYLDSKVHQPQGTTASPASVPNPGGGAKSCFSALGRRIDIRLLLIGALLPDIIDKPLGQYFFRQTFSYGRIYAHTLLFLVIIALAGWVIQARRGRNWLLVIAFGTLLHFVLDSMWGNLQTLLWPLYGWGFPRGELTDWLSNTILYGLLHEPGVYVPEIIGAAIIIWFALGLLRQREFWGFIWHGRVD